MRTSKTRYQHLGDHLKDVLNRVTNEIDDYINTVVTPQLPELHGEEGSCSKIDLEDKKCIKDCVVLHHRVCNCIKHRRRHLEMWSDFIKHTIENIIPEAIQRQLTNIDGLKLRSGHQYKTALKSIVKNFGNIIKESFISLQNVEIKNHQIPLQILSQYKRDLNQSKYIGSDIGECAKILSREDWSHLKEYARSFGVRLTETNKKSKNTLSTEICNTIMKCM